MEKDDSKVLMGPIDAIVYCQNKLGSIPYTVKDSMTIGAPLAEVITILDQLKNAIVEKAPEPEKVKTTKKKEA